jgi:hypothetical protein
MSSGWRAAVCLFSLVPGGRFSSGSGAVRGSGWCSPDGGVVGGGLAAGALVGGSGGEGFAEGVEELVGVFGAEGEGRPDFEDVAVGAGGADEDPAFP